LFNIVRPHEAVEEVLPIACIKAIAPETIRELVQLHPASIAKVVPIKNQAILQALLKITKKQIYDNNHPNTTRYTIGRMKVCMDMFDKNCKYVLNI
jgi:hypothetical protein